MSEPGQLLETSQQVRANIPSSCPQTVGESPNAIADKAKPAASTRFVISVIDISSSNSLTRLRVQMHPVSKYGTAGSIHLKSQL